MKCETEALRAMLEGEAVETISGIEYSSGKLLGRDVVIATCGIGKVFAALCAQTMILTYSPDVIINTGVAGTLTENDKTTAENAIKDYYNNNSTGNAASDEELKSTLDSIANILGMNSANWFN